MRLDCEAVIPNQLRRWREIGPSAGKKNSECLFLEGPNAAIVKLHTVRSGQYHDRHGLRHCYCFHPLYRITSVGLLAPHSDILGRWWACLRSIMPQKLSGDIERVQRAFFLWSNSPSWSVLSSKQIPLKRSIWTPHFDPQKGHEARFNRSVVQAILFSFTCC